MLTRPRVLLVEDEDSLATGLVDVLTVKGYSVCHEATGTDGLSQARQGQFDLLLLDVELPDLSGFEILKTLREEGHQTRVMMLTARKAEIDKVLGFELGVDDYVTKPFSLSELLGRIKALLRRSPLVLDNGAAKQNTEKGTLEFGQAKVDLKSFRIHNNGVEMKLPIKAFAVLQCLIENSGRVVDRNELIDQVWGADECITQRTLNNLIVKLRQAIEVKPEEPIFLKTIHGLGYRLELPEGL